MMRVRVCVRVTCVHRQSLTCRDLRGTSALRATLFPVPIVLPRFLSPHLADDDAPRAGERARACSTHFSVPHDMRAAATSV